MKKGLVIVVVLLVVVLAIYYFLPKPQIKWVFTGEDALIQVNGEMVDLTNGETYITKAKGGFYVNVSYKDGVGTWGIRRFGKLIENGSTVLQP